MKDLIEKGEITKADQPNVNKNPLPNLKVNLVIEEGDMIDPTLKIGIPGLFLVYSRSGESEDVDALLSAKKRVVLPPSLNPLPKFRPEKWIFFPPKQLPLTDTHQIPWNYEVKAVRESGRVLEIGGSEDISAITRSGMIAGPSLLLDQVQGLPEKDFWNEV